MELVEFALSLAIEAERSGHEDVAEHMLAFAVDLETVLQQAASAEAARPLLKRTVHDD